MEKLLSIVAKPSFFNQWNYKNQTLDSLTFFKKPFKINSYIFNFPSLYFTIRMNQTKKKFHVIKMVNPMKLQWIALSDQICILFTLKIIAIQDILLLMLPKINERRMFDLAFTPRTISNDCELLALYAKMQLILLVDLSLAKS